MPTSSLTSKGQTTIPLEVRRKLGLKPGDKIDFVIGEDGLVILRPATNSVTALRGLLKRPGQKRLSVDEMEEAVRRAATGS
jgi:AbrB family looped-hinge helix DNA binding protein